MSKRNPRLAASSLAAHRRLMAEKMPPCPADVAEIPGGSERWAAIVGLRMSADWSEHQLHQCAQLARLMALADLELDGITEEGTLVSGAKGLPVQNPRIAILQALLGSAGSLRRGLGLNATADPRTINVLPARKSMAQTHAEADDDDLIG